MKARFYGYSILILCLTALLASCKSPTSSPSKAWVVSTLAGSTSGDDDGTGTAAKFNHPYGVAVNSDGNVYVADADNQRIRKITIKTVNSQEVADVSTLAGSTSGYKNGSGTAAKFDYPTGVAVDSDGNIYVADTFNDRIRKITIKTVNSQEVADVSTLAGSKSGDDDGTGTAAQFNRPYGVAVDSDGNVYVADTFNHRIRKIAIDSNGNGVVSSPFGSGTAGSANGVGTAAQFKSPRGLAVHESSGNIIIYVADEYNNRIRKIAIDSNGNGVVSSPFGSGTAGSANGVGTAAQFKYPYGVAVDSVGNIYVADTSNNRIRKITVAGVVSTLAGSTSGDDDGTGTAAQFNGPSGLAVHESSGNIIIYVADYGNHRIRKMEYRLP